MPRRLNTAVRLYLLSYPVLLPLAFVSTWLLASWTLGHQPQPLIDDPTQIGTAVDIVYLLTGVIFVVGLPLFATGLLYLITSAFIARSNRKQTLLVAAIATAALITSIALIRADPLEIIDWYMD